MRMSYLSMRDSAGAWSHLSSGSFKLESCRCVDSVSVVCITRRQEIALGVALMLVLPSWNAPLAAVTPRRWNVDRRRQAVGGCVFQRHDRSHAERQLM